MEAMREAVFQDRNPWSMTVEEYGERLMARRAEAEAKKAAYELEQLRQKSMWVQPGYSPDEQEELERRKQSEWDNWTDDNPRGSGNSMRRN